MIGETILAGTSARCKQVYNWCDNISLIIGLQSASWWSLNIYCANCWPTIGAPIIVPPILTRSSAVPFNSANPTWDFRKLFDQLVGNVVVFMRDHLPYETSVLLEKFEAFGKNSNLSVNVRFPMFRDYDVFRVWFSRNMTIWRYNA